MFSRAPLMRRLLAPAIRKGRSFARDDRGVTMIEFGILALPFFTIIYAILETAMVFFASQVLDSAVEDASRMVRTGRAQAAEYDIQDFRDLLCGSTFNLFGGTQCAEVKLNISVINTFASATQPVPQTCDYVTTKTCTWATWVLQDTFQPGVGRQIVQVQAYYRWPLLVNLPYFNLKNQPDNYRLISATRVFRNEPFT